MTAQTISQEAFTEEFVRRMRSNRLWQHPFFKIVRTMPVLHILQEWAIQAGRIDEAFATVLSNMLSNPAIPSSMHPPIEENLSDELGHGDPDRAHFTLIRDVLSVLGISEEEYRAAPFTDGTQAIVRSLLDSSSGQPIVILALMASEELICPNEFPILLEACSRHGTREQLRYFEEHIEADVQHSYNLIRMCYQISEGHPDRIAEIFRVQSIDLDNNARFYDDLMIVLQMTSR